MRLRLALAAAAALSGCSAVRETPPVSYRPVSFTELPGWRDADPRAALAAFRLGCNSAVGARLSNGPWSQVAPMLSAATADLCRAAARAAAPDAAAARSFFEAHFAPYRVLGPEGPQGLFTGYYEPRLDASRTKRRGYAAPIYGVPPEAEPGAVLPARADIENGAAGRNWPVLFWARDPVDVFTLQIQGSGRLALAGGRFARVAYAGNNGRGYVAIGRLMKERGLLPADRIDMPAIQAWLRAHPAAGRALMQENPRYIFFREIADARGTTGQLGVTLTAMASLAVDPAFVPPGLPLWIDTNRPGRKSEPLRLLAVAQDTGGAIKGPVRGDIFFGSDRQAALDAGRMAERGRYFLLLPKRR